MEIKVSIEQDENAQSPRENDNLGVMVCWHRRYNLGDKNEFTSPEDFKPEAYPVCLPLYLYDHSGITMRTRGFSEIDSARWDWGQVGWIFVSREKLLKEYGGKRVTAAMKRRAVKCLLAEVEVYDHYIRGDVYGYVVEDGDGNHLDSCWGFFGYDPKTNGMVDNIDTRYRDALLTATP